MSETVKEDPGIPPDPYRMVYIIFYWLGVGTLLPWNFFISVPGEVLWFCPDWKVERERESATQKEFW